MFEISTVRNIRLLADASDVANDPDAVDCIVLRDTNDEETVRWTS